MDIVRKILFMLPKSDRWKLLGFLGLMLIGSLLEVVGIGMIPVFVSTISNPEKLLEIEKIRPVLAFLSIEGSGDLLVYGGVALISVFIVKNIYMVWFQYIKTRFMFNRYSFICRKLFRKYMCSSYTFILSRNTSEVVRNVTQETALVIGHVMEPLLKLMMDLILVTSTLVLLFWVSPYVTMASVVLFAVAGGGFLSLVRSRAQMHGRRIQVERKVMIQSVNEGLGGLKDIRVLQRSGWFLKRFNKSVERFGRAHVFRGLTKNSAKPILETVAVAGMLMIVLILYWQGQAIDTIVPLLALFGAAAFRLLPTMREVVEAINSLRFHGYAVHPIYEEFRREEPAGCHARLLEDEEDRGVLTFEREIRFEGVSYCYPERETCAVADVSLVVRKGEAVGFIGPSGAGKTTAVDLLLGILEPQRGRISVDGIDIHHNLGKWLRNIGYIPQSIFLTDDTLKRNIALGLPDEEIDEGALDRAITAAQLRETVDELPDGLDTLVGERGVRLSGGQRQRIGIARALYGNPQVLIMDEATSSLDPGTERYVIEAMERLKGERTIIMISHRLTTVRNCDRLFVIEEGRLSDSGTFAELSERNAELCQVGV